MGYSAMSSGSNSFANRLSSSSYVDPPSFSVQLTPDIHHPESVPRSVPESVSDDGQRTTASRTRSSSFHSKRQPAVAIIDYTIIDYTIIYYTILQYTILQYTIIYYNILYYNIIYSEWWGDPRPISSLGALDGGSDRDKLLSVCRL